VAKRGRREGRGGKKETHLERVVENKGGFAAYKIASGEDSEFEKGKGKGVDWVCYQAAKGGGD